MTKMFSYSGPAQLIYPEGATADIECRLAEFEDMPGGLRDWSGSGTAARPLNAGEARLRLPNGDEADVIITNVTMHGSSGNLGIALVLQGSGAPPGLPA